jgi:hypothetical protein
MVKDGALGGDVGMARTIHLDFCVFQLKNGVI